MGDDLPSAAWDFPGKPLPWAHFAVIKGLIGALEPDARIQAPASPSWELREVTKGL